MTARSFVTHDTGVLGIQRDILKALYYTCHIFSQRRTVSRLETHVPSKRSGFKRTQVVVLGVYSQGGMISDT